MDNVYLKIEREAFSQNEYEDIKRCLETLLSVRTGSQPMDRNFGINFDEIVDYPIDVAQNMIVLEITEKVAFYEPRVDIGTIDFERCNDGKLSTIIRVFKAKGVL